MTEQFLHRSDVVSILEQVRRKGVAEGVAADALRDPRPADRGGDRALYDGFVQVIPGWWSESRVSVRSRYEECRQNVARCRA